MNFLRDWMKLKDFQILAIMTTNLQNSVIGDLQSE